MDNHQSTNNGNTANQPRHGCLTFFLVIAIIVGVIFGIIKIIDIYSNRDGEGNVANKDGNPILLERAARYSDISVTESTEASLSNLKDTYIVVPRYNIKNLQITFSFYNDSGEKIKQITKDLGNVVANSQYTITVGHTLSELSNITKYGYSVTGGSVSNLSK